MHARKIRPPEWRHQDGLTVFEILTVAIVITVLVGIAVPNFITSKSRGAEGVLQTNVRVLRVMLETYKTYYQVYPEDLRTLGRHATEEKYNKSASNPFNGQSGIVESGKWAIEYVGTSGPPGVVAYQVLDNNQKYYIFAYTKNGKLMERSGEVYAATNG